MYVGDLIGCEIIDKSQHNRLIGTVTDVDREAGLLAIETPDGNEALVPFAKDYLIAMNLPAKRIEMHLPAGLLEINAPITEEERREQSASDDE